MEKGNISKVLKLGKTEYQVILWRMKLPFKPNEGRQKRLKEKEGRCSFLEEQRGRNKNNSQS